jgi:hypothetical protein
MGRHSVPTADARLAEVVAALSLATDLATGAPLEAAADWLVDVLGCEYMYTLGPFRADDDWMSTHLHVHSRAVIIRLRFFRLGEHAVFEVFDYEARR